MRYRRLGKSGIEVSEIGFGAWAIGGAMWGGPRDREATSALEHAVELGVNFIDTALSYGEGHSESLVGALVRRHPERTIYVATKVPPRNRVWPAPRGIALDEVFPAAHVRRSCEDSLRHLGLDRIDLLQLHVFDDGWLEDDRWFEELARLRDEGKVRLVGVSINDHDPASALRLARSGRVDALQVIHNIFDQSAEDELLPACQAHGVGVLARVPLDEGSLTGKLRADTVFPAGDFRAGYFAGPLLAETVARVDRIRPVLEGAGAASMVRGALRYCLSHPAISTVIPGMRTPAQVEDDVAASADGPLPPATLEALRAHRWVPRARA